MPVQFSMPGEYCYCRRMGTIDGSAFLAGLPRFPEFEDIADFTRYRPLPDGWGLALADIVDSTGAIAAGRYKSVNMAGASLITAVINGLGRPDLPFVFGGDGALVAIPPSGIDAAKIVLARVKNWVEREFALQMRAALVPISDIRAAGLDVRVARFQVSSEMSYAMFAGGGASWAEEQMKQGVYSIAGAVDGSQPNLTGLSCRWNPISSRNGRIVSVIAVPGRKGTGEVFRHLLADVVALAGTEHRAGHPVPPDGPELALQFHGVDAVALTSPGRMRRLRSRLSALSISALLVVLHRFNLKLGRFDARLYARDVSQNTDFRKFDDALKMTLDIDAARLAKIETRLEEAERAGMCHYGLHVQDQALITCIVPSPISRDHMHFVDGAMGGYAEAASHLKEKLRKTRAAPLTGLGEPGQL